MLIDEDVVRRNSRQLKILNLRSELLEIIISTLVRVSTHGLPRCI